MKAPKEVCEILLARLREHGEAKGFTTPTQVFKVSSNNIGRIFGTGSYVDAAHSLELQRAMRCHGWIAFELNNTTFCFMRDSVPNTWLRLGFAQQEVQ